MSKKSSSSSRSVIGRRAWRLLRLVLLWARKGELIRGRVAISLHKLIRKVAYSGGDARGALMYGDHEFSFDQTPIVRVKMHRPTSSSTLLPCIQPQVDFDDDDDDEMWRNQYDDMGDEEEGIDVKAEKFISDFYEHLKHQTHISYLESQSQC